MFRRSQPRRVLIISDFTLNYLEAFRLSVPSDVSISHATGSDADVDFYKSVIADQES